MMKYQLWDMISYSEGEDMTPFTLLKESKVFSEIYSEFNKKNNPCVIILVDEKSDKNDLSKKIYESPDNGKTIYERDFLGYNRKKIK